MKSIGLIHAIAAMHVKMFAVNTIIFLHDHLVGFMVVYLVKKQMSLCQNLMDVILCVKVRDHQEVTP